jgi:hypothetical protein
MLESEFSLSPHIWCLRMIIISLTVANQFNLGNGVFVVLERLWRLLA